MTTQALTIFCLRIEGKEERGQVKVAAEKEAKMKKKELETAIEGATFPFSTRCGAVSAALFYCTTLRSKTNIHNSTRNISFCKK